MHSHCYRSSWLRHSCRHCMLRPIRARLRNRSNTGGTFVRCSHPRHHHHHAMVFPVATATRRDWVAGGGYCQRRKGTPGNYTKHETRDEPPHGVSRKLAHHSASRQTSVIQLRALGNAMNDEITDSITMKSIRWEWLPTTSLGPGPDSS